ncbi:MAG TPA: hypothetical protein VFP50_15670, partial [Anaeromyxobacteraceae bacterium]|nr:hypothetical protein [Anaeromyxobacteraceae bacterium]
LSHDRYAELKRRHDLLRKEHEELIDAVRQAAREERRLAEQAARGDAPAPASSEQAAPAAPAGETTPGA